MSRILNIGSVNIDHVYHVPHFVQPEETLSASDYSLFPGGKGLNQSVALARAGGSVFQVGKVGPDGADMVRLLQESGVDTRYLEQDGTVTGHAMIQVDAGGQNCILLFAGANHELRVDEIEAALAAFCADDVLILQNEVNDVTRWMQLAHARGMRIALNPSPISESLRCYPLELVTWFLLNEIEGQALTGHSEPEEILDEMQRLYPASAVVLTVGKDGVRYREGLTSLSHGIYDVPVVDTTAAGDTFTGYFLSSVVAGKSPEEALRLASVASSIAVSRQGAAPSIPTLQEVQQSQLRAL